MPAESSRRRNAKEMSNAAGMASFGLVIDCHDPEPLAEFWATALGYVQAGAAGNYGLLLSPDGDQPKLLLQRVPEAKRAKNRLHIASDTPESAAHAALPHTPRRLL